MQTNELDLKRARFLSLSSLSQLANDLFMEFDPNMEYEDRRTDMPKFPMILWYMRNYTYAPMSAIGNITGVSASGKSMSYRTADIISTFVSGCFEKPVYLNGDTYESLQIMKQVGTYYGLEKNLPLERLDDDVVDAVLYLAHLECNGYSDPPRKQGGGQNESFPATPKNQPTLVTVLDLEARLANGASLWEIHEDYIIESINTL